MLQLFRLSESLQSFLNRLPKLTKLSDRVWANGEGAWTIRLLPRVALAFCRWEHVMRSIRIIDEPNNTYAYAAVDRRTGEIPLRHHDRTELIALCRRLEWRIEEAEQDARSGRRTNRRRERQVERSLSRSAKLPASSRTNKPARVMRAAARTS